MLTRDQVANDEINLLFGYIDKGHPNSDVYLFPPQWLLEKECPGHFHGIITPAGQALFYYIVGKIASPAIDNCWKTMGEWRSFLRSSGKGKFAAKDVPTEGDFEHGTGLLKKAFGDTWNMKVLRDITVPEPFLEEIPGESPAFLVEYIPRRGPRALGLRPIRGLLLSQNSPWPGNPTKVECYDKENRESDLSCTLVE
ncbi:hypothetical protein DFH09DRAFT_1092224 [Mycena vulgaris]|nr:hypothetical protein DFH09DRAFT_1092224 [Mycena vulgaris]